MPPECCSLTRRCKCTSLPSWFVRSLACGKFFSYIRLKTNNTKKTFNSYHSKLGFCFKFVCFICKYSALDVTKPCDIISYFFLNVFRRFGIFFQRQWSQDGSCFVFESPSAAAKAEAQTLDTSRIAKQTIYYAKQLEMIV